MRRISSFIAALLLAVWLPATGHCNLEAAGVIAKQCADDCGQAGASSIDGCGAVEGGFYKNASQLIKAPAPDLQVFTSLFCLNFLVVPEPSHSVWESAVSVDRPLDWVPSWSFVRRAAPLSRAPSLVG